MNRVPLALTIGDINGIGPEVLLRALQHPEVLAAVYPIVVGRLEPLQQHAEQIGLTLPPIQVIHPGEPMPEQAIPLWEVPMENPIKVTFGVTGPEAGLLAMRAVEEAVRLVHQGVVEGIVTAPIAKKAVRQAGYPIAGHTEFIAQLAGSPHYLMMMVAGDLRVGLVTIHIPLREVPAQVTKEQIIEKATLFAESLTFDFGLPQPRIAVLGLNPHAGEGGILGREEDKIIIPALRVLQKANIRVEGPFPADSFFGTHRKLYDGVLAMYHDQGLAPFKALAFDRGVNVTAGLPLVRTSPDHGTAFDLAGKGIASPRSMVEAILMAAQIVRVRQQSAGVSAS